jgi:LssY C-terminus
LLHPDDPAILRSLAYCEGLGSRVQVPDQILTPANIDRMTVIRRHKILASGALLFALVAAVTIPRSFRFRPNPSADVAFTARAQQKSAPGIKVRVSALGARESQQSFGEDLAKFNIQPVWLSIVNETDDQLAFVSIEMDPDYYSPYEVSYRFHGILSFAANRARDEFFLKRQIANVAHPHSITEGFLYGVLDAGVKYAHIVLAGKNRLETFDFALPVPGPAFVGTDIDARRIYPTRTIEDVDLDTLRAAFAAQPCCTTSSDGQRNGDPLNLVIVESKRDPIVPFVARGWHLARKLDVASIIETARAFIFRDAFLTSPVSPLYVFDRKEDVVVQKARSTINERVHARLWLTPYTFEGRRIWIGQVSRDIGVRLTAQTWNLTTHKIAPDVDFDRTYLLQDLAMSGFVERYGYLKGVGPASEQTPRTNLTGDPYYTDGLRAIIFLANEPKPLESIERLPWDTPQPPTVQAR